MKTIMVEYCNSSTEFKVRFDFDKENVNTIKLLDSKLRKYDPDIKCWIVKVTSKSLEELKKLFDGYIAIEGGLEEKLDFEPVVFDTNYKISAFKGSFQLINNEKIKKFAKWVTVNAPDYFFEIPASSTGKYHPRYALKSGGLVLHTLSTIIFANHLFPLYNFNQLEQDLIIASLIMHDMAKNGIEILDNGQVVQESDYTVAKHPIAICEYVEYLYKTSDEVDDDIIFIFKEGYWDIIKGNVQSHMGIWNKDYKTKEEILPKPVTQMEKFVSLCVYLGSRRNILVEDLL